VDLNQLAARIDELGTDALEVSAYRHVAVGIDPRSGEGARIHGGRWNPPESFACLYLALDAETVADELHRLAARQSLRPDDLVPRELHLFDVRLQAVLDLRSVENQEALGLTIDVIRADDASACQQVGEAAHYLGVEAVIAPSAAGPGVVLAVFTDRLRPGSAVTAISSEIWTEAPPARGHASE
jgi:RES domain-containing protein